MSRLAWINLLFLSLIWGAAFTFSGAAVREVGFATVVFLRVFIACVALGAYLALRGQLPALSWRLLGAFLIMGLFNNLIPFGLLFWAQSPLAGTEAAKVSSGLASIFNALTPFFAMLVARFAFGDEPLSVQKVLGVALGFMGVGVLFLGSGGVTGVSPGAQVPHTWQYLGMAACALAALSYGFGVVFGRRFSAQGLGPSQGAFGQLLGSSILGLPLVLLIDQPWGMAMPSATFWGLIAGLALVSTAIAYMIYFWLIAEAGAVNSALVTLLVPASAMVLGVIFLGERFGAFDYLGLALILLGLIVIDGRLFGRILSR